jgi:thiol-disulfide isomerase/thioredoxin
MLRALVRSVVVVSALVLTTAARASDAPTPSPFAPLGPPPWLGVTMDNGGDLGVRVEHVVKGSPAEKGGVRPGDRIVTIDGARVNAPIQVTRAVQSHKVGETVAVGLERGGNTTTASVVLASRPSGDEILKMDLVGSAAPAWSNVTPLAGAPASLEKLKGRVVLVDFWASWCGPCRMLAPKLSALKDRFGAQGLTVVGITTDDAERAAVFAEKHQMRYPTVVDNAGDTSKAYGITGLPTMVLVDKKGVIRDVYVGFDPTPAGDAKLESTIKALLAEGSASAPPQPSVSRPAGR